MAWGVRHIAFNKEYQKIKAYKTEQPDPVTGCLLLHRAGLSEGQQAMARCVDAMTFDEVAQIARFFFENTETHFMLGEDEIAQGGRRVRRSIG